MTAIANFYLATLLNTHYMIKTFLAYCAISALFQTIFKRYLKKYASHFRRNAVMFTNLLKCFMIFTYINRMFKIMSTFLETND